MTIDATTKRWIKNVADERAAANGCAFDEGRGQYVVDWCRKYLRLYEGEHAGEPFEMRDWQYDATMRLFGWVKFSERWGRKVRRFTKAGIWVPKKNKKSPTLAAWGLYTLAGDGEQGQKVFFGAKDGSQAREIAGKHAIEMVLSSPELSADCKINLTHMQITHLETRSILKPMSSGDSKTQKSKEGINGSVFIDETHVVDREFVNRISRAGISRSEPLFVQLSTAGNDPEGYGKSEFDYGLSVESGETTDEQYLFIGYYAPQDITDEQLAADPVKYGKHANPAWGHTVGEEEYLADYNRSRGSISDLADFKMYRLNVWQASDNPWLNMGDWSLCRDEYTEADLLGQECWGGLDLAKTRDTTALVLIFPTDDDEKGRRCYRQLAYFWLPESRAAALRDKVNYQTWAKQGHITLTHGNTCDYRFVQSRIAEVFDRFRVQVLAIDKYYSEQLVQNLVDDHGLPLEAFVEFPQTISAFAAPTAAYERAIIDKTLRHNGNPLLTWQAGNVRVKPDPNGNIRPVKQQHGDYRTVDGMVAGIMAYELAMKADGGSVYEHRGLIVL